MDMKKLLAIAAVAAAVIAVVAATVTRPGPLSFADGHPVPLPRYGGRDPTGVPPELRGATLIRRGEYLARAADCEACHTAPDGIPYAGGLAFKTPFGTLYSTNVTPDKETGIGMYTDAVFLDVLHKGVRADGSKLYPAMPYPSYTYMTDADALAIKAYLFSLDPVYAPARPNALSFPFNQRQLMVIWSTLFNPDRRFEPNADRDADWNRGAYLTEALAHCGECHTPRNLMEALNNRRKFAGTIVNGWVAYNITPDHVGGIGAWSDADLAQYLSMGHANKRGTAAGPMGEAIDKGLSHLTAPDMAALITYLRSVPVVTSPLPPPNTNPPTASPETANLDLHGREVFTRACAGCHGPDGVSPFTQFATLTGVRSVNDPSGMNVVEVILWGFHKLVPDDKSTMPALGGVLSDAEIASVANYVTGRFGVTASTLTPERVAKQRAEAVHFQEAVSLSVSMLAVSANPSPHTAPDQPLPFSHEKHTTLGLECRSCHTNPAPGAQMTFPATTTCMGCHAGVATDRPAIRKLTQYASSHQEIPWVRVYEILPGVKWSHLTHLRAGVQCAACHGSVSKLSAMEEMTSVTSMANCISCHQTREVPQGGGCATCHAWPPSAGLASFRPAGPPSLYPSSTAPTGSTAIKPAR
jgi:mono/diheme cytochrome c family protein